MPKVIRDTLPPGSRLHGSHRPGDFLDCYSVASDLSPRQAAEVITSFPRWASVLLILRNAIVAPFGIRTALPSADRMLGPFPVDHETETEIIAGFDDRHLDFRIAIRSEGDRVAMATWVRRKNRFGRVYLAAILPFHVLIVRNALARVGRAPRPPAPPR